MPSSKGFTLIELLVVIAIIAILMIVVVVTLNPGELLKQSRDSNRLSDMASINTALGLSQVDGIAQGTANTVYVSIPDPSATSTAGDQCQGLGLISLPAAYAYHCAASSTYRKVNGQGWIPVNLSAISQGSPISLLPTDPFNTSSTRNYYTYATDGTNYEVTMVPESQKYQLGGSGDVISGDGGTLSTVYEKGSKLGLEPLDYGDPSLVGLWTFDEGTGTTAYDYSGNNATGTWTGNASGTSGYYSAGKVGPWAGYFNGNNDIVSVPNSSAVQLNGAYTLSFWLDVISCSGINYDGSFGQYGGNSTGWLAYSCHPSSTTPFSLGFRRSTSTYYNWSTGPTLGQWILFTITYDGSGHTYNYVNGILNASYLGTQPADTDSFPLLIGTTGSPAYGNQEIDDVRIYNRALSAAQIAAMYAGGK